VLVEWVERHPVVAAGVGVVFVGGVAGVLFGLLEPDMPTWALVAVAVAAGAIVGVAAYVRRNHNPLPVMDTATRARVRRALRDGGPVDRADAPHVVAFADKLLGIPFQPTVGIVFFAAMALFGVFQFVPAVEQADVRHAVGSGLVILAFVLIICITPLAHRRRRRAEVARHQALEVLGHEPH
jgi:hypothetical protein